MRQKSNATPASSETLVRNIRRATRKHYAPRDLVADAVQVLGEMERALPGMGAHHAAARERPAEASADEHRLTTVEYKAPI